MSKLNTWQNSRLLRLGLALAFGLALLIGLLLAMGAARPPDVALAQGPTPRHVDSATGNDSGNDCTNSSTPCATVQHAVDVADPGDEIRVATGTYTDVQARTGITQVVYISKTVTVRGGYTTTNWTTPDPLANPTTLDAQKQGRVLYITGGISPTMEGLRITGGYVKASGGGIYNKDADLALINTTITNNISSGIDWPDGLGGGVYVGNGSMVLSEVQIISNSASYKGGGVLVWGGSVTLNGGQIINNTANGPTYWDGGGGVWVLGSATLSGGQIISNSASHGGGLYVYLSDVTLSGVQIIDNSAAWAGGGVFIWPGSDVTLNGGEIINNSAYSGGGVASGGAFITLTNSVVSDNRADGLGSGLSINGDSIRLMHTTIARNLGGDGSGVHVEGSATVAMTNTILVSHTVGITVAAGNTATLECTLWGTGAWANDTDWGGAGTIVTGTCNYWGDPAFLDPDAGDYHIGPGSAAIDVGVNAGVDHDIDGDPRPMGQGYDIGADEFRHVIYLPIIFKDG
jgi:hypothetical protein